MKKTLLAAFICLSMAAPVAANFSPDAIAAIQNAETIGQIEEQRRYEVMVKEIKADEAAAEAKIAKARAQELAVKNAEAQKAKGIIAAAEKAKAEAVLVRAEALKRDNAHEDELRKLALEDIKLELKAKAKRVERTDDIIDVEIKRENAHTDVVQSEADARRIEAGKIETKVREPKPKEKNFLGF